MHDPTQVQKALARNDRYLVEFIEALNLCPYAKSCREGGKLHREVLELSTPDVEAVAARVAAVEAMPEGQVDVALLILPSLQLEARPFEKFVAQVRAQREQARDRRLSYFVVAFHPGLSMDLGNADRAVTFLRRSPDPTIQMVSASAIERVKEASGDPDGLSRIIAEAGLRAVLERGPEALAALLDEIHRA